MSDKSQKILIIEASSIICRGIKSIFASDLTDRWQVQSNSSVENLNSICTQFAPQFLLINPLTYVQNKQLIEQIKKDHKCQLIGIIFNHYHSDILRNFDAQILIDDEDQQIINTLGTLENGNSHESLIEVNYTLSKREKEILKLIASGYASSQIAETLFISLHTVNTHRKNIMNKLDIKTVSGLTIYAVLNNIISLKKV